MYQRTLVAIVLCSISSLCFSQTDCDAIAGMAAGEASYRNDAAQVKASDTRLHFYSAPASDCQLPAFLVHGNTVEILRDSVRYTESGGIDDASKRPFYYVRYRDAKGVFATGWIIAAGLVPLANPLPVPLHAKSGRIARCRRVKAWLPRRIIITKFREASGCGSTQCQMSSAVAIPFS